jgi:hypothetical protein
VSNRVWLRDGFGLLAEPVSMPASRAGLTVVERLVSCHDAGHPAVVVAIEAIGSLHRPWLSALERSYPGAVRRSLRRRPMWPGPSWGRAGSRPMIGTAPR